MLSPKCNGGTEFSISVPAANVIIGALEAKNKPTNTLALHQHHSLSHESLNVKMETVFCRSEKY